MHEIPVNMIFDIKRKNRLEVDGLIVISLVYGERVDLVHKQVYLVFTAELHEFDEGLRFVAPSKGIMRMAYNQSADACASFLSVLDSFLVLFKCTRRELINAAKVDVDAFDASLEVSRAPFKGLKTAYLAFVPKSDLKDW